MQSSSIPELDVAATTTATAATSINTKKKKRRRSKKSSNTSEINAQDNNDNIKTSILNSNLSLKKHTQLKKSTKLTPWYDINELISVGNGLLLALKLFPSPSSATSVTSPPFSSSTQSKQSQEYQQSPEVAGLTNEEYTQLKLALHTVAIWRGKSDKGGRLSHAIDITAGLASVLLMDAERSSSATSMISVGTNGATIMPTIYQIRSTYSTLLLRSVNGLADTYRHSSKSNTLSVSYCCKLAGLPLWIVDIRHDASHNDLPTLGVCRIGALESLMFWSRRYWKLLEGKCYGNGSGNVGCSTGGVGEEVVEEKGIYTLAVDCLVCYQNAVVNEVCCQNKKKGEKKKAAIESTLQGLEAVGIDNGSTSMPSNEKDGKSNSVEKQATSKTSTSTGSANPWSILDDDKPKKKRKKSKKDDNDDAPVSTGDKPVTTAKSQEETAQPTAAAPPSASSRDCAAEFIRTIPIDIAHSTAIQFLVWGRTSMNSSEEKNTNVNGPALLTLPSVLDLQSSSSDSHNNTQSSTSSQEIDTSFEQLRIMYEPLIIAITNVYPGFIMALFVHLIDSILCLDKARRQSQQGDGDLDVKQLELHTQYIFRWIRHILSRAFHMHFDKSVAMFIPKIDQSVVIKPPLQTETTTAATDTMSEQAADEKIFTPQPIDLKKKGRKKWTQAQLEYMQSPLDNSSLKDMGFPLNSVCDRILSHHQEIDSGTAVRELKQHLEDVIGKERVVFMGIYGQSVVASEEPDHGTIGSTSSTPKLDSSKPPREVPTEEENNILSLEDMEAMLDKNTATKKDNNDAQVESDKLGSTLPSRIAPWTLCKSWDTCAIGTLPGHPV